MTPELRSGQIKVDKSHFGDRRNDKRGGKLHVVVIPDVAARAPVPIIRVRMMTSDLLRRRCFPTC